MTENEVKAIVREIIMNYAENGEEKYCEALDTAVKALEEVQQYRAIGTPEELKSLKEHGAFTGTELAQLAAMQMRLREYEQIGTPEECRTALEKQKAKKPILTLCKNCQGSCDNCDRYIDRCPSCNGDLYSETSKHYDCCPNCGQKLDWSDEE